MKIDDSKYEKWTAVMISNLFVTYMVINCKFRAE